MNRTENLNLLVLGGAGYVGSHVCKRAKDLGLRPITYDDLSTGHYEFVKFGPLVRGDIRDLAHLKDVLRHYRPSMVIHLAAKAIIEESIHHPKLYYDSNVGGVHSLLLALKSSQVEKLVFTSTCSVYGESQNLLCRETDRCMPINPYGASKLECENLILDFQKNSSNRHLRVALLRLFNIIGGDFECGLWEWHEPETHIIPSLIDCALKDHLFTIYGDDYLSPDRSSVRDYIDVHDVANAHIAALSYLDHRACLISNIGSGIARSTKEMLSMIETLAKKKLRTRVNPCRQGDPGVLVADTRVFRTWYPHALRDIETSVLRLWDFYNKKDFNERV